MLLLLASCFFLSGVAGLVYQTAWTLQFALVFGSSELAVVAVLAAYMGGLTLGAWLASRWVGGSDRPILIYGLLELGIAVSALIVPAAVSGSGRLQSLLLSADALASSDASASAAVYYLVSSFSILLVPTALMGATLPILARYAVRRNSEIGLRVGFLYSVNTAGAAIGTVATAFFLLPRVGVGATVQSAAAVNALVFGAAVVLSRKSEGSTPVTAASAATSSGTPWILPAILISGAVSFSWEVLWTRLLTPLLGGSVYAFATMLATFLLALALGSAIASPLASTPEKARRGFGVAQLLIAVLSVTAFVAADQLPDLIRRWRELPGGHTNLGGTVLAAALGIGSLLSAAVLMPSGLAIGATFPFAVRILARDSADAAAATARIFAWNTVGAIVGALATGYFLLPELRFAATAGAAAATSLILATTAALVRRPRRLGLGALAAAGISLIALNPPPTPWRILRYFSLTTNAAPGEVAYYGVGRSANVLLTESHGEWRLTTNGLPESSIESYGYRPGRHVVARWLSLLPIALRPDMQSLLAIGLGAGVSVENLPASVKAVHVVEIEPEVIRANQSVAARRRHDPLADPRLSLHVNDARGALRLTRRHFGAIVSQPSHPWTSGSAHLFTREFYTLVRERLEADGVFVQWMGLSFVDESLLRSLIATAAEVFVNVEVYQPRPASALIVASAQPLDLAATAERALADGRREWRELGVICREDLLAARVLDDTGARRFAGNAPLNTDARNLLRMRSPGLMRNPAANGEQDLTAPFEPSLAEIEGADLVYSVRRLIRQRAVQRARRVAEALVDPVARRVAIAWTDIATGDTRRARRSLQQARHLDPNDEEVGAAWLEINRSAISSGLPTFAAEGLAPEQFTIAEGWRLGAAGDWRGIRRIDHDLATIGPRHPLFLAATRLRAQWRTESGEKELASEALELMQPLLAPVPNPRDLLLRARAGAASGEPRIALAALSELFAQRRTRNPRTPATRVARRLLSSLRVDEGAETWRRDLLQLVQHDFEATGPGLPGSPNQGRVNGPQEPVPGNSPSVYGSWD